MQFCAYRLRTGQLVLDMQSDVLSHLKTRLVAPLVPESAGEKAMTSCPAAWNGTTSTAARATT